MRLQTLAQVSRRLDDPREVVKLLHALGLKLPDGSEILRAQTNTLRSAPAGFTVAQLDAALDETELPPGDRMQVKVACFQHGLLRRSA